MDLQHYKRRFKILQESLEVLETTKCDLERDINRCKEQIEDLLDNIQTDIQELEDKEELQ